MKNYLLEILAKGLGKVEVKGKSELTLKVPTKWLLVIFFSVTALVGVGVYTYFDSKPPTEFEFKRDYMVSRFVEDDHIDSEEKLQAILKDDRIEWDSKLNPPVIGANVCISAGKMSIVPKHKVDVLILKHYHEQSVPKHDYVNDGYIWIPNVYISFKNYLQAMYIDSEHTANQIIKNSSQYKISHIFRAKVGNLLVRDNNGTYYVAEQTGFDMIAVNRSLYSDRRFTEQQFLIARNKNIENKLDKL